MNKNPESTHSPPGQPKEWVATMVCSRCHHVIRQAQLNVRPDGTFELEGLPVACTKSDCLAAFGEGMAHTLDVRLYRCQRPGAHEGGAVASDAPVLGGASKLEGLKQAAANAVGIFARRRKSTMPLEDALLKPMIALDEAVTDAGGE